MRSRLALLAAAALLFSTTACQTYSGDARNPSGYVPLYEDPTSIGRVAGVGIESNDIVGMTEEMVRDMLASPVLAGNGAAPRVVVDSSNFRNQSSSRINVDLITQRMRSGLIRAAKGRMRFLSAQSSALVVKQRELKRRGITDHGSGGLVKKIAGEDYWLVGTISSLDTSGGRTGAHSRYHQISFEMVDTETSEIVWNGLYEFKKASQDDVIYR